MIHPQFYAKQLKKNIDAISENACCAFVCMWCCGIEPDDSAAVSIIHNSIENNVIGKDCLVLWKPFILSLTGREVEVEFKKLTREDYFAIKDRTPVLFRWVEPDGTVHEHWVGVENGQVQFDPFGSSLSVMYGAPVEARIIRYK